MSEQTVPEAWVLMPSEGEIRTQMPPGAIPAEYDFGFLPAMGRLIATHDRIGPKLAQLFRQIMFEPGHLSRQEREMIAAVTSAAQDCHY